MTNPNTSEIQTVKTKVTEKFKDTFYELAGKPPTPEEVIEYDVNKRIPSLMERIIEGERFCLQPMTYGSIESDRGYIPSNASRETADSVIKLAEVFHNYSEGKTVPIFPCCDWSFIYEGEWVSNTVTEYINKILISLKQKGVNIHASVIPESIMSKKQGAMETLSELRSASEMRNRSGIDLPTVIVAQAAHVPRIEKLINSHSELQDIAVISTQGVEAFFSGHESLVDYYRYNPNVLEEQYEKFFPQTMFLTLMQHFDSKGELIRWLGENKWVSGLKEFLVYLEK